MRVLGIDPGASGALVVFDTAEGTIAVADMPVVEVREGKGMKRRVSAQLLAEVVRDLKPDTAALEKVGAMPGQGVSSMFSFGRAAGVVEGVLAGLGVPMMTVSPREWQTAMRVRDGKDGARARAAEMFPNQASLFARVKDDGRADAALIAAWRASLG